MAVTLELGASHLELNYEGLNVHVARAHFTPKQWERLWEMLKQAQGRLEWLRLPFQTSKQEGARWKKICLDVFSMVVYILLIPLSHKLVQLIHPIDWREIDRRCAKPYKNAIHGARAYAHLRLRSLSRTPVSPLYPEPTMQVP